LPLAALLLLLGCQPGDGERDVASPQSYGAPGSSVEVGITDFVLPQLSGDSLRMADYQGKVVLLNFWATWCGPCRYEIPDLVDLHTELGPDDFSVIGISVDEGDFALVEKFADDMEINYPVGWDRYGAVSEAYGGVYALPMTFVIDRSGEIVHRTIGLFPTEAMKKELQTLIDAD